MFSMQSMLPDGKFSALSAYGVGTGGGTVKKRQMECLERAAEHLDLPADAIARVTRVEITDDRNVYLENHRGLLEYGDDLIRVRGCGVVVSVSGSGLRIRAMTRWEMNLSGRVERIEFLREDGQ